MQPKISVIVPIYNTGKILRKTLKSIQNQTFKDFECLLVNDGSTNPVTLDILNKFTNDHRFRLLHKENEGIEKTRLYGVHNATADLILFCDHDDYYELNALEVLYGAYQRSKADIIVANSFYQRLFRSKVGRRVVCPNISRECVLEKEQYISKYYYNFFGINYFPVPTWGKLYKKSIFNTNLRSFGFNFMEDVLINLQLFEVAESVHFIPNNLYTHIYGGLSSQFNFTQATNGYAEVFEFRKSYLHKHRLNIKTLLVEYKNVVNQNINLLIDNKTTYDDFQNYLRSMKSKTIMTEVFSELSEDEKGSYILLLEKDDYQGVYELATKNNSWKRKVKHAVKSIVKKF